MPISRGVLIVLLLGTFIVVPDVYAHRPESGRADGITEIPDPSTSYAYYRELDISEPVHIYRFEAQAGPRGRERGIGAGLSQPA